jgi:hypothetical protein
VLYRLSYMSVYWCTSTVLHDGENQGQHPAGLFKLKQRNGAEGGNRTRVISLEN